MNKILSQTIHYLRLPLIIGVIFTHAYIYNISVGGETLFQDGGNTFFEYFELIFSQLVCRVAVPGFLLISGLLYFWKVEHWSKEVYMEKNRKRVRSLLVPYFIWNAWVLLFFYVGQTLPATASFFSSGVEDVAGYGIKDYLMAFWATPGKPYPINYPLWFLRDLMLMSLMIPLIRWLIVRGGIALPAVLFMCCLFNIWFPIRVLLPQTVFYFTLGCYFGIKKIDPVDVFNKLKFKAVLFPVLVGLCVVFRDTDYYAPALFLMRTVGMMWVFTLVASGFRNGRLVMNETVWSSSFFLYLAHEPLLTLFRKVTYILINPIGQAELFLVYFLPPVMLVALLIAVYLLIRKNVPGLLALLTGSR